MKYKETKIKSSQRQNMSFLPYDSHHIRCSPLWSSIVNHNDVDPNTASKSRCCITVACVVCHRDIIGTALNLSHHSIHCNEHNKDLRRSNRERYNGQLPHNVTLCIRAGLLRGYTSADMDFLALVGSLTPDALAAITEVAGYRREQWSDNTFWLPSQWRSTGAPRGRPRTVNGVGRSVRPRGAMAVAVYRPLWHIWAPLVRRIRADLRSIFCYAWLILPFIGADESPHATVFGDRFGALVYLIDISQDLGDQNALAYWKIVQMFLSNERDTYQTILQACNQYTQIVD